MQLKRLAQTIISDPRVRIPLILFTVLMGAFFLQRALVYLSVRHALTDVSASAVRYGFLVGLRFDTVIASMLVAPLLALAISPPRLVVSRFSRWLTSGYCGLVIALALFALVADYFFFQEFGGRLDHKVFNYFGDRYVYRAIWQDFPVIRAVAMTLFALFGTTWAIGRVGYPRRFLKQEHPPWNSRRVVFVSVGWTAIMASALVVGIRSSFTSHAVNTSPAFFSSSLLLSQVALNGLFTLREAVVSRTLRDRPVEDLIDPMAPHEALAIAAELFISPHELSPGDTVNPLRRTVPESRPQQDFNVVLVVLESLHADYLESLGGLKGLTPNLDRIAREGILFDHCFAIGPRTSYGFTGAVAGFPDLPGRSVSKRIETIGHFLTLGRILQQRGYETMFIYGGEANTDHRGAFLGSNGFKRLVCEEEFPEDAFRNFLGYCDGALFERAHREFVAMGQQPFAAAMLTLTFHRPYQFPADEGDPTDASDPDAIQRAAIRYTDRAVGKFIEQAQSADYFRRTIFVFVADHMGGFAASPLDVRKFRVPWIIYAPGLPEASPRVVHSVCSQTDVAPTILSLLGGSYDHCFFGSSVLDRPPERGVAVMQTAHWFALIDSQRRVVVMPFNGQPRLYQYEAPNTLDPLEGDNAAEYLARLQRQATAVYQSASIIFKQESHNLVEKSQNPAARVAEKQKR